jgi:hypothetical protein
VLKFHPRVRRSVLSHHSALFKKREDLRRNTRKTFNEGFDK